jgi:hypothetical protein
MADDRRSFEYTDKVYYINTPVAEDIKGADWQYSKVYTKSLVEGISTSSEMHDILTRRGIIGPDYEQRREELEGILNEKVLDIALSKDSAGKQKAALEVAKAREELFRWNQRLNGPMSNTCEQIADDARLEYLTSRMVENEEGSKIWETFEDYLAEPDQPMALTARFQVMIYLQGMSPDFLENTPEAVAMREVEDELKDIAKELAKQEVIEEQEKVEVEEKPKKTRKKPGPKKGSTRKKTTRKTTKKTEDK